MSVIKNHLILSGALCASLLSTDVFAQGDKLVIEAGHVITRAGEDIENGVIVVENGRIAAIGKADEIERPWDAVVVGGPDYTAAPGFVEALTWNGMDRPNENLDVTPYLDVRDSIDPVHFYFEDCKRWGITTINVQQGTNTVIAGQGRIVKPVGMTVEEMTVRPMFGHMVSIDPKSGKSRATQRQALRNAFGDLRRDLEGLVQEKRDEADTARREALAQGREQEESKNPGRAMAGDGWKVEGLELVKRDEIDAKLLPLLEMAEGREFTFLYCGAPMDVQPAIDFAKANGLAGRAALLLDDSCWKAADAIKAAGLPVILDSDMIHVETDPVTEAETETFVPKVFADKGIPFALRSANSSTNSLWFQAAVCVANGMTREQALAAVTTTPAQILGLDKQVGSLEVGKAANVLLLTGDPLDITSRVHKVVIDGDVIYDHTQDSRNRHLLEGEAPRGAAAAETEESEAPSKQGTDDEPADEEKPAEDEAKSDDHDDHKDAE